MNQELINKIVKLISDKKNILKGTIIRTDNNIVDVKLVNNKIVRARLLEDTTDKEVNVVRDENNNYYAWNDKTKRILLNQNHKFRKNRQREENEDTFISFYAIPDKQVIMSNHSFIGYSMVINPDDIYTWYGDEVVKYTNYGAILHPSRTPPIPTWVEENNRRETEYKNALLTYDLEWVDYIRPTATTFFQYHIGFNLPVTDSKLLPYDFNKDYGTPTNTSPLSLGLGRDYRSFIGGTFFPGDPNLNYGFSFSEYGKVRINGLEYLMWICNQVDWLDFRIYNDEQTFNYCNGVADDLGLIVPPDLDISTMTPEEYFQWQQLGIARARAINECRLDLANAQSKSSNYWLTGDLAGAIVVIRRSALTSHGEEVGMLSSGDALVELWDENTGQWHAPRVYGVFNWRPLYVLFYIGANKPDPPPAPSYIQLIDSITIFRPYSIDIRFNDGKNDISLLKLSADDQEYNTDIYLDKYRYGIDYHVHDKNTIEVYIQYGTYTEIGLHTIHNGSGYFLNSNKKHHYQHSFHCYITNGTVSLAAPNDPRNKLPKIQDHDLTIGHYLHTAYIDSRFPPHWYRPNDAIAITKAPPNYNVYNHLYSDIDITGELFVKFTPPLSDTSDEFNDFVNYSKFYFENYDDLVEIDNYQICNIRTSESDSLYYQMTNIYYSEYDTIKPFYKTFSYSPTLENKVEGTIKTYPSIYKDKIYFVYINKDDMNKIKVTYNPSTQILNCTNTIRYRVYKFVDSGIDLMSVNPLPNYPFKIWKRDKLVKEGRLKGKSIKCNDVKRELIKNRHGHHVQKWTFMKLNELYNPNSNDYSDILRGYYIRLVFENFNIIVS